MEVCVSSYMSLLNLSSISSSAIFFLETAIKQGLIKEKTKLPPKQLVPNKTKNANRTVLKPGQAKPNFATSKNGCSG